MSENLKVDQVEIGSDMKVREGSVVFVTIGVPCSA